MKKEIDFKQIEVKTLDGTPQVLDMAKELGNAIYAKTMDLGELELAREIYKNGKVEIDEAQATMITHIIRENFLAFVQESICPVLEKIFINDQN